MATARRERICDRPVADLGGVAPGLRRSTFPALAAGELVPGHLRAELGHAPAVNIRLISLCAGRGRDVIGVLARHPHRDDVRARLVELDERNWAPTPAQHLLAVENELNNRPGASSTTARQQNYSPRSRRYGTRPSTLAAGGQSGAVLGHGGGRHAD